MALRVLVFEYLSAGGRLDVQAPPPELLAQGLAMQQALVQDLSNLPEVALHVVHSGEAPPAAADWPSWLSARAAHVDRVWAVAPECDGLLLALHGAVGATRWVGCSAGAIATASSKSATLAQLARHGVCTPLAFATQAVRGAWVVKPDDGAGAADVRVHTHHADALADHAARARLGQRSTLEPWVDGEALSLSLLCAPGQAELLSINRQQIERSADGTLTYRGVQTVALPLTHAWAGALRDCAAAVARALPGLHGYVGVDVVWHAARGPVAIEVNPRLTCAYVGLSKRLGRCLGGEILALARAS